MLLSPQLVLAQSDASEPIEEIFKAKVIEILEQKSYVREDGSTSVRQKLKLNGLAGAWKNKEIIFDGMEFDLLSGGTYRVGDDILVNRSSGPAGEDNFYIIGYSRTRPIYWLAFLFALIVVAVGRFKGFRALLVLALTFLVILEFIIPKILSGSDPLIISAIGSLFILVLAVYLTEGFKRTATLAVFSVLISLIITSFLSVCFSAMAKLTGFANEETMFLIGLAGSDINIKGLLLAGIIIGALGVLDDVVISQISLVQELKISNPELSKGQLYKRAMKVGISHLSSMVNTLFLAYAGASLPLLILFSVKQPPFLTFNQVLDNEMIATEIVRTLTGSIGLILAVPIATFLAVQFINKKIIKN
ncbi:MAG TPA: YibE/F family protein [bacterium]|nr:YibE/F family protein [bacterium]